MILARTSTMVLKRLQGVSLPRKQGRPGSHGLAMMLLLAGAAASPSAAAPPIPEILRQASSYVAPPFTMGDLGHALLCMVVAATLGTFLAFRPRRAGGPPRVAHTTQAQIMMAIVGALVMLVVGASLARAFAIAGTAGLVRYRAKIDDPKDASVMLSCLAVGLASGVGLLYLAVVSTVFIVGVLWLLEWREPWPSKRFELKVSAKDPLILKGEVETLLTRQKMKYELRGATEKDITFAVEVPQGKRTDRISEAIVALHGDETVNVEWDEKKLK